MLPVPSLDNEEFGDILDEARNLIVSLYPKWTDFNYHDPGITLIEMFAWLKESQQFHMDQISEQSRKRYLKLLGERQLRKAPSRTILDVLPSEDIVVLPGTKLYAGQTCFTTETRKQLVENDAVRWFFARTEIEQAADRPEIGQRGAALAMFGLKPVSGDCFYICFNGALPKDESLSLYFELAWAHKTKRNPNASKMAAQPARLSLEYYTNEGWQNVSDFSDETYGAIENGFMHFSLNNEHIEAELFGTSGHFLRVVLMEHEYDIPPLVSSVSVNRFLAVQRDDIIEQIDVGFELFEEGRGLAETATMGALSGGSDVYIGSAGKLHLATNSLKTPDYETGICKFEFDVPQDLGEIDFIKVVSSRDGGHGGKLLGEGTGFPYQEFDMDDLDVLYENFSIIVSDPLKPDEFAEWFKVDDFSKSSPEDRHYVLDTETGIVSFGDCIKGLAPDGDIIVTSYARCLGRNGDVTANKINRFDGLSPEDMRVYNSAASTGGRDEELLSDSFTRVASKLSSPLTAVSNSDYERLVMDVPGLVIESCKVISAKQVLRIQKNLVDDLAINIVVKQGDFTSTESGRVRLTPTYRKNILTFLERHRLVGRKINLYAPVRINFEVFANIMLNPHYIEARETVSKAVEEFFDKQSGKFGITFSLSELYGEIEKLPCVVQINSLNVDARSTDVRSSDDGSISLPPNGVCFLGNAQYLFSV